MLFFDLDGTLTDSNGVWKDVDRTFLARRGLPYTHAYYEGVAHTIFPAAARFTKEFCRLPDVPLKPGVRAYLKQCRAEGRQMAVVTSSVPVHCRTALENLKIEKYFQRVVLAHDLGLEKKEPDIWLKAAELCGVEPASCTVFDDSLEACKGARRAGMRTVGVYDSFFSRYWREMRSFCDIYIESFEELLYSQQA